MPRLREIFDREELPEHERHVHDELMRARGRVSNSYAAMMHAPGLVKPIVDVGTYVRFHSSLPKPTIELIALATSAEFDNPYEWQIHEPLAAKLGVDAAT